MEKKSIRIRLEIIICIFIIVITCIGLIYYYFKYNSLKSKVEQLEQEIVNKNNIVSQLQQKINIIGPTINNNNEKTENLSENILKVKEYSTEYKVKLKSLDENFIATCEIYAPVLITENEYEKMKDNKKITLNGKEYKFSLNVDDNSDILSSSYGYLIDDNIVYSLEKYYGDGYVGHHEIGGVHTYINKIIETIKVQLSEKTEVYTMFENDKKELKDYKDVFKDEYLKNNEIRLEYNNEKGEIYIFRDPR